MNMTYSRRIKVLIVEGLLVMLIMLSNATLLIGQSEDNTINFIINESSLMTVPVELRQDYSMIPIQHFAQVTGASLKQENNKITLTKDDREFTLILDCTTLVTEAGSLNLPICPFLKDGLIYVPLRFLCDQLNIAVNWDDLTNTISLNIENDRLGMKPQEILAKTKEASQNRPSYKVSSNMNTTIYNSKNQVLSSYLVAGEEMVRQEPYTTHLIQNITNNQNGQTAQHQYLVTEHQLFTKANDQPWLSASVNVNSLLRSRDEISLFSLDEAADTNISTNRPVYTYADDIIYQDQPCFVINVYYSPTIFEENLQEFLPALDQIDEEMHNLFSDLTIQKFQTIYINKDTLQQVYEKVFEELELHIHDQAQPYARFHTEGELNFTNEAFNLPSGIPTLME